MCRSFHPELALVALIAGLVAVPAAAYDRIRIDPSIVVRQQYDSNVFNREKNVESDLSTLVMPSVRIAAESDTRNVFASYRLNARRSYDFSDLDTVQHLISMGARQSISRRLSLSAGSTIRILPKTSNVEDGGTEFQTGRPDLMSFNYNAGMTYQLTPRSSTSLNLVFGQTKIDSSSQDRAIRFDSTTRQAVFSYQYILSNRDAVTSSLTQSFSEFEPNDPGFQPLVDPSDPTRLLGTATYRACGFLGIPSGQPLDDCDLPFAVFPLERLAVLGVERASTNRNRQSAFNLAWRRSWSPRWRTSLSLGVRALNTKVDDRSIRVLALPPPPLQPPLPPNAEFVKLEIPTEIAAAAGGTETDLSFNFVGGFNVVREGRNSSIRLNYSRTTRPSTSEGAQSDFDVVRLDMSRRLSRNVTARLLGIYGRRESANNLSNFKIENWRFSGTLTYRISRDWTAFVDTAYRTQSASGEGLRASEFDGFKTSIGFTYRFPFDFFTTGGAHVRPGI